MRKIKFRGKRVDNGKWIYGYYGVLGKDTDIEKHVIMISTLNNGSIPNFYFEDVEVDQITVGQFTGLKDKNGVDIYEGDIVKYPQNFDDDPLWRYESKSNTEVKYVDKYGCFDISGWFGGLALSKNIKKIEVIGNNFESRKI